MSNLKEFTIVWTILVLCLIITVGTIFLPFTAVGHTIFGAVFALVVMFLKKTYCTFKEESRLDSMFGG